MDATTNYALRVGTLMVIGAGLPAWALFGKFPGPTHAAPEAVAAKPTPAPTAIAVAPPKGKVVAVEPVAQERAEPDAREPSASTASIPSQPLVASMATPGGRLVSPPAAAGGADRLTQVQDRLKQLGAYYLLLESMNGEGPSYRFHAAIGAGPSDSTGRRFEVTDSQPMRAMERVLAEVEQWSTQRLTLRRSGVERK